MASSEEISAQYPTALRQHLAEPRELGFSRANETGRNAIAVGISLLDMVLLHHGALRSVIDETPPAELGRAILAAGDFFSECVSPFEMLLRRYHEKNWQLQERTVELEAANQALNAANRELETFAYSVSHDLRAPLRAVDGFSAMLQEDYAAKLDADACRLIQNIRDGTQRMARLIDDVLVFSRVTRRQMVASVIDMNALVQAVLATLAPGMTGRAIEVKAGLLPPARGDQEMMQRSG